MLKSLFFLTEQLLVMVKAGLSYERIFSTLIAQQPNKRLRHALKDIKERLLSGSELSEAMRTHPEIFEQYYTEIIAVGEISGRLEDALYQLKQYLKDRLQIRRQLIRASIGPIVMFLSGFIAILSVRLILAPLLLKGKVESAGLSGIDSTMCFFLKIICYFLIATIILLGIRYSYRYLPAVKRVVDTAIRYLPLLSEIFWLRDLSRFTRLLSVMLSSGIPILRALNIIAKTNQNSLIKRQIEESIKGIEQGKNLSDTLKSAHILDPATIGMIETAEYTGRLDEGLLRIAKNAEEQFLSNTTILIRVTEIILILTYISILSYAIMNIWSSIGKGSL